MNFPDEDFPAVRDAVREFRREAKAAGVWIFGGGFEEFSAHVVEEDGSTTSGPLRESPVRLGGFSILEVATEADAFDWAKKIAVACRCPQEVRKIMDDPEQEALQRQ